MFNPAAAGVGTHTITYTFTDVNGCTNSATASIKVNALPTATVSGSAFICLGSSTMISAALTGTGPWNVTWSDGVTQNGVASPATRSVSPGSTTTYTVTNVTDANGCSNIGTGSAIVTVNTPPTLTAIGAESVAWGNLLSFTATASDPNAPPQTLTFSLAGTVPMGASITPGGLFSWTPTSGQIGMPTLTVRVTDPCGVYDEKSFTVNVGKRATMLVYGGATSGQYSDQVTLSATLTDAGGGAMNGMALASKTVGFTLGTQSTSGTTNGSGVASANLTLNQAAGSYSVVSSFVTDSLYLGSGDSDSFTINKEDASIQYTGDSIALVNTDLMLRATVWDSAATGYSGANTESGAGATIGDITKMWIAFDIYSAGSCTSGTPTTKYAQVSDTGTGGDGIGTASTTYKSTSEASYCVVARLVAGNAGGMNLYYTSPYAEPACITFYNNTGQFVTGGGWINDPGGGKGNFGFNARYNKKSGPQGQMVYVYRGLYMGVQADFIIKSNSLTALRFVGTTYPISATLQGKCTIQINRASDGVQLYGDGNATFNATAVDSGQNSGIGSDTYALRVYDKNAVLYKDVPTATLQGGNVVVH
jgi:hypothetical protein